MRAATLLFASVLALGAGSAVAQTNTSSTAKDMWPADADLDGDDMISQQEAMLLGEKSFSLYDYDKSSDISMQEWRMVIDDRMAQALKANPNAKGPENMDMFTANTFLTHDVDNNGVISRVEWDERVTAHFAKMDANGDGMIDANEVPGAQNSKKGG